MPRESLGSLYDHRQSESVHGVQFPSPVTRLTPVNQLNQVLRASVQYIGDKKEGRWRILIIFLAQSQVAGRAITASLGSGGRLDGVRGVGQLGGSYFPANLAADGSVHQR